MGRARFAVGFSFTVGFGSSCWGDVFIMSLRFEARLAVGFSFTVGFWASCRGIFS